MQIPPFISLDRQFTNISRDANESDDLEAQYAWARTKDASWDDLFREYRVVVLASAGAGKTAEIKQATIRLRAEGNTAFFIRLENLIDDLEIAFEGGELGSYAEFQTWRGASEAEAWIFLDSVDEARLKDHRDFDKALRRLSSALGDHGHRARVFVTSRASEWVPPFDAALVDRLLPYKSEDAAQGSSKITDLDEFEGLELDAFNETANASKEYKTRVVILNRLDYDRVSAFIHSCDVNQPDRLLEEIKRHDVSDSTGHPQDLISLIEYWEKFGKIGSRYDRMKVDVEEKLEEKNQARARMHPIAFQKSKDGALLLAAAVTLQKKAAIQVPGSKPADNFVNSEIILTKWDNNERTALLSRGLFDPAIYGSVRFHHRSVREFLTAEWFAELLKNGKSRREIEGLFFRSQYGETVISPTLRPILPWLALLDEPIRNKALEVSGEVLFEGGDPSALPGSIRVKVLTDICGRLATDETYRTKIDHSTVRRFASKDIEMTVRTLLEKYRDQSEAATLLLNMVWHAKLQSCTDLVFEIATTETTETYTRIAAIRALAALENETAILECLAYVKKNAETLGRRVVSEIITDFSPKWLSAQDLVALLTTVPGPQASEYSGLDYHLNALVKSMVQDDLVEITSLLLPFIVAEPHKEPEWSHISLRYGWLLQTAALAVHRLAENKHSFCLTDECLTVVSLVSETSSYGGHYHEWPDFAPLVSNWRALKFALFWNDVRVSRERYAQKDERVTSWWQACLFRRVWNFDLSDYEIIVPQISQQDLVDNRLVAQSLAFALYRDNEKRPELLKVLKHESSLHEETRVQLQQLLDPPIQSELDKNWKRQEAGFKRRSEERERKDRENIENWKVWLAEHTSVLNDTSLAKEGGIWKAQNYLRSQMREAKKNENRWGISSWRSLVPTFGSEVAQAFREGLIGYWRLYEPKLRSDGIDNPNSVPHGVVFALSGLKIEAEETENWPAALTDNEATNASRYAVLEMNGFASWLPKLFSAFPEIVTETLVKEIEWEIKDQTSKDNLSYVLSDIVWHGSTYDDALAPRILACLSVNSPTHPQTLENALKPILRSKSVENEQIAQTAISHLQTELPLAHRATWCTALFSVKPDDGLHWLTKSLEVLHNDQERTEFCMRLAVHLNSDRRSNIAARPDFKQAHFLCELLIVLHKHIRVESDIDRAGGGVYSPELRDDAQTARNGILSALKGIPGKETYLALMKLAQDHPYEDYRKWMQLHAYNRAVLDSDIEEWESSDLAIFARDAEKAPSNDHELFSMAGSRLLDLKHDLEHGDTSNADLLSKADNELQIRNYIAGWVRGRAFGKYNVAQEDELADAKRPDIRFYGNGFDNPVPSELKIADRWSGNDLFERLENQLSNDYLRDERSRFGIFLLVRSGKKSGWEIGESKRKVNFDELCSALQEKANQLIANRFDKIAMSVIGIDLTKRETPIRTTATKKPSR